MRDFYCLSTVLAIFLFVPCKGSEDDVVSTVNFANVGGTNLKDQGDVGPTHL
jgi:hypothetical protein